MPLGGERQDVGRIRERRRGGRTVTRRRDVVVHRGLPVPMDDGAELTADRYVPRGTDRPPVVLVRTLYSRDGIWARGYGRALAERGFQVIIQSVRARSGPSPGPAELNAMAAERTDGLATLAWIRAQPWFGGRIATAGISYLGYAQWAIGDDPELAALCIQAAPSDFADPIYDGDAFALRFALAWTRQLAGPPLRFPRVGWALAAASRRLPPRPRLLGAVPWPAWASRAAAPALRHRRGIGRSPEGLRGCRPLPVDDLPLDAADRIMLGRRVDWYQDWLTHRPGDGYWAARSHTARVPEVTAAVSLVTGWHDLFLPWTLRDHAALVAAGNPPRLTIGPWAHTSPGLFAALATETAAFLTTHLLDPPRPPAEPSTTRRQEPRRDGETSKATHSRNQHDRRRNHDDRRRNGNDSGARVRFFVTGADQWRESGTWPPPGLTEQQWSLQPEGGLSRTNPRRDHAILPARFEPSRETTDAAGIIETRTSVFRYDPRRPTPSVGGPDLIERTFSVDNRRLERRDDVLVFTSAPLAADLDVIGTPRARITVSADHPHHDVFVRLCDVHPSGVSRNVSDRLIRMDDVTPAPDGTRQAVLDLWPLAHRFRAGHRLRVQVSAGAHPRYARNLGTGEPLATGTTLRPTTIAVHHDPDRRSTLTLPTGPPA